jgi:hypothetical protein
MKLELDELSTRARLVEGWIILYSTFSHVNHISLSSWSGQYSETSRPFADSITSYYVSHGLFGYGQILVRLLDFLQITSLPLGCPYSRHLCQLSLDNATYYIKKLNNTSVASNHKALTQNSRSRPSNRLPRRKRIRKGPQLCRNLSKFGRKP